MTIFTLLQKMSYRNGNLWRSIAVPFNKMFHKSSRFDRSRPKSKSKEMEWKRLRPRILERIKKREKDYPVQGMIPVAEQVLKSYTLLHQGVSTLIHHIPIWTCRGCPELYVGENGHLIRSCPDNRRRTKDHPHKWIKGSLKDILIPVETFSLRSMSQIVYHNERFDYDRIPAVVELCRQAGAEPNFTTMNLDMDTAKAASFSELDLQVTARETLEAWETARSGLQRLLCVYPAKVCKHCSEVHVGVSGHMARLCGVFEFTRFHGKHFWENVKVDNLIPPRIVWFRRPQDPPLLGNERCHFYGQAPAVVDLCSKAGAIVPFKYYPMMKVNRWDDLNLTAPNLIRDKPAVDCFVN